MALIKPSPLHNPGCCFTQKHGLCSSTSRVLLCQGNQNWCLFVKNSYRKLYIQSLIYSQSSSGESSSPNSPNSGDKSSESEPTETDPVKLAFAKARAYKKSLQSSPIPKIEQGPILESTETKIKNDALVSEGKEVDNREVPIAVKLAMEKAKEYKKNKGAVGSGGSVNGSDTVLGSQGRNNNSEGNQLFDKKEDKKPSEPKISSMDFIGLEFSDKKTRKGLPPGLLPISNPFPDGDIPEVEIIVGDASKFGNTATTSKPKPKPKLEQEDNEDLYKPKVSTWGVFPRPKNISKTYGGGRVIHPGDVLETEEEKSAKEARTRQLLAAYNSKLGSNIDPKLKSECEQELKDGDSLMDLGKLEEALPFYEKIMAKLAFETELYGLAALQWSICQDSLCRPNEAQVLYKKLQSHPNVEVSKKARHFMFSFQAMEMMKVKSLSLSPMSTGYQNYFEAFVEDKNANYNILEEAPEVEDPLNQALPYIIFLVSPIFIVLLFAIRKGI